MRAKAKHAVNYNGTWYATGEIFEINPEDARMMKEHCLFESQKAEETHEDESSMRRRSGRRQRNED